VMINDKIRVVATFSGGFHLFLLSLGAPVLGGTSTGVREYDYLCIQ